jgi:hypothetical protein
VAAGVARAPADRTIGITTTTATTNDTTLILTTTDTTTARALDARAS